MFPISDQFVEALRGNPRTYTVAHLYKLGIKVMELFVSGGSITNDSTAATRRRCNLQIDVDDNEDLVPAKSFYMDKGLWPAGNEIQLYQIMDYRGLYSPEIVPIGRYRISKPVVTEDDTGRATIQIEGFDRSRAIGRNRFTDAYAVTRGVSYSDAIKDLIMNRYPHLVDGDFVDWLDTGGGNDGPAYGSPGLIFERAEDPWDKIRKMTESFGGEVLFDGYGRPVLRMMSNPQFDEPVFDYIENENATFTGIQRTLDDTDSYNGVVVTGQNSNNEQPIRAEAWDTEPDSPTYYDPIKPAASTYGPVPYFITSEYVKTTGQAQAAAETNLAIQSGIIETVTFDGIANFAHESGDVIRIKRDRVGVDDNYVLESYSHDLGSVIKMSGKTRKRKTE